MAFVECVQIAACHDRGLESKFYAHRATRSISHFFSPHQHTRMFAQGFTLMKSAVQMQQSRIVEPGNASHTEAVATCEGRHRETSQTSSSRHGARKETPWQHTPNANFLSNTFKLSIKERETHGYIMKIRRRTAHVNGCRGETRANSSHSARCQPKCWTKRDGVEPTINLYFPGRVDAVKLTFE